MNIIYDKVKTPIAHTYTAPVDLTAETMKLHLDETLAAMGEQGLDALVIYADREHGANFAYLTGFEPRFEEALLVLHKDGRAYYLLGNENLKMARFSFVPGDVIHVPHFSLPYQPMETEKTLVQLIHDAGLRPEMQVGIVGWKHFTGPLERNEKLYDVPSFIVDAIRQNIAEDHLRNAAGIFLDSGSGLRNRCNANEIAHYEFGAGLASASILRALNEMEPGMTEMDIANFLVTGGQPETVTRICATGDRFTNAVVFPRAKKICRGDKFSITLGLRGGLSSRAAYVAATKDDLPEEARDYVETVTIPYYKAAITWLSMMKIGTSCADIYRAIEEALPKDTYHWVLNPGHYTSAEEWSSSPVYPGSSVKIKSGMLLQLDIIPSVPGYGGVSAEDGIAIADSNLRDALQTQYPETWQRIVDRKAYLSDELRIQLPEEVLPMSDILGYLRPLLLAKDYALVVGS